MPILSHYYTYLKTEEYEKARQFMARLVKGSEWAIAENIADFERQGKYDLRDEYSAKKEKEVEGLREELRRLSIPDAEYFRRLVSDNEAKSLEYINSICKRKKA